MATSILRAGIVAAAVVLGIFVLANAFPAGDERPGRMTAQETPTSPKTQASPTQSPRSSPTRQGRIDGVVVQVLNATETTGLAGSTTETLEEAGYAVEDPGNAADLLDQTIIYYRSDSEAHARLMKRRFFPDAQLRPATSAHPPGIQLTVVLGADFEPS